MEAGAGRAGPHQQGGRPGAAGGPRQRAEEAEARRLGEELARLEEELRAVERERDALLLSLPNLAEDDAPDGGEDDAVELRARRRAARVRLRPARPRRAREAAAGALDLEAAARVSGSRFAYLLGPLVRVQIALVALALDRLEAAGFTPVIPPVLVREEAMWGTGFFPTDRASIYETADDDLFLVGTSEVPLAGLHGDADPGAPTTCRCATAACPPASAARPAPPAATRAASSACTSSTRSRCSRSSCPGTRRPSTCGSSGVQEEILQALELPYRVVDIAVGDLGASAARKFDCEAWMPGQGAYREVTSCSNCTDYQARRLRARVRGESGTEPVHTLNGTAVAVGRTIIALLENDQREDGSVALPAALRERGAPAEIAPR